MPSVEKKIHLSAFVYTYIYVTRFWVLLETHDAMNYDLITHVSENNVSKTYSSFLMVPPKRKKWVAPRAERAATRGSLRGGPLE